MSNHTKRSPESPGACSPNGRGRRSDYPSPWVTIKSVVPEFGYVPQTLNEWIKRSQVRASKRTDVTNEEVEQLMAPERGEKELPQASQILRSGSAFLAHKARCE